MHKTRRLAGLARLLLCLSAALWSAILWPTVLSASEWKYVGSTDQAEFSRPLFRSVALSTDKPAELESRATYRGKVQRYVLLRYGSPNSQRVAVVVDEVSRSDFDLYVDANRDFTIELDEKIAGAGRTRQTLLAAALAVGDHRWDLLSRQVVFRRGLTANSLSVATLGFSAGTVSLEDKQLPARRVDGNGDGLFSASRDRLWIDTDNDGRWDAFSEQFPYLPILKIEGQRCAVRGDLAGRRLKLEPLTATGRVRLSFNLHDSAARVVSVDVMLVGADGSAVSLHDPQQPVEVAGGEYTVGAVMLVLQDSATKTPWNFVFSDIGYRERQRKFTVKNGQEVAIDPVGELRLEFDGQLSGRTVKPGGSTTVCLRLYTEDDLLINSSSRGTTKIADNAGSNLAAIWLQGDSAIPLATTRSGFA